VDIETLLDLNNISKEWYPLLTPALKSLDNQYLDWLLKSKDYIPSKDRIFSAFSSMKPSDVKYILFGQDPYPRIESATGYAFIDGRVKNIFSQKGLSKEVNRATSLRNFIKMALVADGCLSLEDTSQSAIANIDKKHLIDSIDELRVNFEKSGVLLLNTALVFTSKADSKRHIREWRAFIELFLEKFLEYGYSAELILFGSYAKDLLKIPVVEKFSYIEIEHPYNHTFISNQKALELFGGMNLLKK
jgi:uracil-DNA glycosylase